MWPFQKTEPEIVVTSPVDLNKPVENPDLKAAILRLAEAQTAENQKALWAQLKSANYLVIFNPDELKLKPGSTAGQVTMQGGSLLKVVTCHTPDGKLLLPAFTDWNEANAFAGSQNVASLVMPSQQLWEFVLDGSFEGAVVNPAGMPLPLTREQLQGLKSGV